MAAAARPQPRIAAGRKAEILAADAITRTAGYCPAEIAARFHPNEALSTTRISARRSRRVGLGHSAAAKRRKAVERERARVPADDDDAEVHQPAPRRPRRRRLRASSSRAAASTCSGASACMQVGGRAAAATRAAREPGSQAPRRHALPRRVLDRIGGAEQLHDRRPHERGQVQRARYRPQSRAGSTANNAARSSSVGVSGRQFGRAARGFDDRRARDLGLAAGRTRASRRRLDRVSRQLDAPPRANSATG